MQEKINMEDDVKNFCKFSSENQFDLTGNTSMLEMRKQYNEMDYNITLYPCILKNESFELGYSNKNKLNTINCLFFYPINYKESDEKKYNVIYYIHGGGFCFGGDKVDHKLPRELCSKTNSIVVYPLYSLSPDVKFPVAIEECFELLNILEKNENKYNIDFSSLIIGGDSAGGNLTIALSLLCKQRDGPKINKQFLINPVTDSTFNTPSYHKFSEGYHLTRDQMIWFFNQYVINEDQKNNILVSPNKATIEELINLPKTIILIGEFDVLRDETKSFSEKLKKAGVKIDYYEFPYTIHDFLNFKQLNNTKGCKDGTNKLIEFIIEK